MEEYLHMNRERRSHRPEEHASDRGRTIELPRWRRRENSCVNLPRGDAPEGEVAPSSAAPYRSRFGPLAVRVPPRTPCPLPQALARDCHSQRIPTPGPAPTSPRRRGLTATRASASHAPRRREEGRRVKDTNSRGKCDPSSVIGAATGREFAHRDELNHRPVRQRVS
jgi:hypothetical protein